MTLESHGGLLNAEKSFTFLFPSKGIADSADTNCPLPSGTQKFYFSPYGDTLRRCGFSGDGVLALSLEDSYLEISCLPASRELLCSFSARSHT